MQVVLDSRPRKLLFLSLSLLFLIAYVVGVSCEFLADYYASHADLRSLQAAIRLQPGNADYHHRLGRYFDLIRHDPIAAMQAYNVAVQLNPHSVRYWLDLAAAYESLENPRELNNALENALHADPTTPDVAWQAANMYLVEGDIDKALREFRIVLQNDPSLSAAVLQRCWHVSPDADALLQHLMPARTDAHIALLDLLMGKKETAAAVKVWSALVKLNQPFEPRHLFEYIKYLIAQREPDEATHAWQKAATLLGFASYLPSPSNLIINGDFSLGVLNGGFDWNYQRQSAVELRLDPTELQGGHRSLSIVFDGPGVSDSGIYQFIAVQPNTTYEFSAYYKAGEMEGAGGPQFVIRDVYSGEKYLASDELKNADFWRPITGAFTTGLDTKLLVLMVARVPEGSPIRGKLWIDNLRLAQHKN